METLVQDLKYAVRSLLRSPGFTTVAVLTLGLGIGANSAIFTLVDRVLLRPLPGVRQPDRLMTASDGPISYPMFRDVRAGLRELDVAAWRDRQLTLSDGVHTRLVQTQIVSGNYFAALGAFPARGRALRDADDTPGTEPVAVVSAAFWRQSLGADPSVLGRRLVLNGTSVTVVGVAADGFRGPSLTHRVDFWVPINAWTLLAPSGFRLLDINRRGWGWLTLVGRLAPGASREQAQAEATALEAHLRAINPGSDGARSSRLTLTPAAVTAIGPKIAARRSVATFLGVLACVVGLILLIACANVANLLVARATGRRREMALRLALGAGRGRLVRQLLTESAVLAAAGGGAALLLAALADGAANHLSLPGLLSLGDVGLGVDGRMVAFTAVVALGTCVLFGLVPALLAARTDVSGRLRDEMAGALSRERLRLTLVATQVALCLVLVAAAGLFTRALLRAMSIPPGFGTDHVALATAYPNLTRLDTAQAQRFFEGAAANVAARPDVEAVAWATLVPLVGEQSVEEFQVPGYVPGPDEQPTADQALVGPDFFRVLDVALVSGRPFLPTDRIETPPVVIVSQSMARRYWPGRSPLGQPVAFTGGTATVVGVASDVRWRGLTGSAEPTFYVPFAQRTGGFGGMAPTLLVRTTGNPAPVLSAMGDALHAAGPDVPLGELSTSQDLFATLLLPQRLGAVLLGAFSGLALLLAAVGIAGVVAHGVAQRRREIGIRIALGADAWAVQRLAVRQPLAAVGAGVGIGVAISLMATRALASFLYGVSPADAPTYVATAAVLAGAAMLAAWLPARRATAIDPVTTLRSD